MTEHLDYSWNIVLTYCLKLTLIIYAYIYTWSPINCFVLPNDVWMLSYFYLLYTEDLIWWYKASPCYMCFSNSTRRGASITKKALCVIIHHMCNVCAYFLAYKVDDRFGMDCMCAYWITSKKEIQLERNVKKASRLTISQCKKWFSLGLIIKHMTMAQRTR